MSMNMPSNTGNSEFSSTGTGKPHWNMYCSNPTVFRHTDLPPALGPEMTSMRRPRSSFRSRGTTCFPSRASVCRSSGWRAERSHSVPSSERTGFTHSFSAAQRAFARIMSMQARYSPARAIPGASGRIRSVNAVSIRTTSRRSAYSSSFSSLLISTISTGSI